MKSILAAFACLACAIPVLVRAEDKPGTPDANPPAKTDAVKAEAGCSHCTFKVTTQCMPAIKVGDVVYIVRVSENASEATKKLVESLPKMKDGVKNVKIVGKILPAADAEKAATAAKAEHKFWMEVGEMSIAD